MIYMEIHSLDSENQAKFLSDHPINVITRLYSSVLFLHYRPEPRTQLRKPLILCPALRLQALYFRER